MLTVLTAESRRDKNGRKRVVKEMLTGSLSHFPRRHRPLSQVVRVLISLLIRSHYVYYLRAWHRLVILLYTRLFWRFCHVVTSIYFWLMSWVRCPNLAIVILRNKVGGGYENITSLKVNSICFKLYRTYSNRTLLVCQMLANLFWGLILKECIEVQENKKKVLLSFVDVLHKTWT